MSFGPLADVLNLPNPGRWALGSGFFDGYISGVPPSNLDKVRYISVTDGRQLPIVVGRVITCIRAEEFAS